MVLDRLDMELGLPMSWATAPDAHRDAHGPLGIKKTLSPLSWNGWGGGATPKQSFGEYRRLEPVIASNLLLLLEHVLTCVELR